MTTEIPSASILIPRLAFIHELLGRNALEGGPLRAVMSDIEQLPYWVRGACWSAQQLEAARLEALSEFNRPRAIPAQPGTHYVYAGEKSHALSFAVDSYLNCVCRTMDALVPYLRRCLPTEQLSAQCDFSELMDGIQKDKPSCLDNRVKTLIVSYRREVGQRLRDYRNRASHQGIVSSECLLFQTDNDAVALRMLLPSNPECKSPSEWNYDPGVPAMEFVMDSLRTTIAFVNAIVNRLLELMAPNGVENSPFGRVHFFFGRGGPIVFGPGVQYFGEPVPYPIDPFEMATQAALAVGTQKFSEGI